MTSYLDELQRATNLLAKEGYVFLGQNTIYGGTSMFHTIKHLPESQRIEIPVIEEVQMGMSAGMALEGLKVCTIYPRMDFLILAINQLVNHLDKVKIMSEDQFKLKGLIIRTAIGSTNPLFPGPQHCQDYTEALKLMCKEIKIVRLDYPDQIYPEYVKAMSSDTPTILIEIPDKYNQGLIKDMKDHRER